MTGCVMEADRRARYDEARGIGAPCPPTPAGGPRPVRQRASSTLTPGDAARSELPGRVSGTVGRRPLSGPCRRQRIEAGAVIPQDLRLGLLADPLERQKLVDGIGEEPVGVRIVGGNDDIV